MAAKSDCSSGEDPTRSPMCMCAFACVCVYKEILRANQFYLRQWQQKATAHQARTRHAAPYSPTAATLNASTYLQCRTETPCAAADWAFSLKSQLHSHIEYAIVEHNDFEDDVSSTVHCENPFFIVHCSILIILLVHCAIRCFWK